MKASRSRTVSIHGIAEALLADGYISLDKQAEALGIPRATTWTIIAKKHKLGRLNRHTAHRILENRTTPPSIRVIIEQALAKSLIAAPQSEKVNK